MTSPRRFVLNVEHWDGQRHQLIGRAAFIAAFILVHAERINAAPRGYVTLNWDGPALRPDLHESFPHVNTDGT